ncbi:MAG TPA: hypothetical protein VHO24_14370 [Opitutaceae bacterium]|nr:hypothetical protein [Opitutaceae bacterium]
MKEGELDWQAAREKAVAAQIETNMTTAPLLKPLTRQQRAMALPSLESARPTEIGGMLGEIAKGLMHDYGEESLANCRTCRCGVRGDQVAGVDWHFNYVTDREINKSNVVTLFLGVATWTEKTVAADFSTFHPTCPACAKATFKSKDTFERLVERVPRQFKYQRVDFFAHPYP